MSLLTFDPIEGVKKKSEDAMKNSIMIIAVALLIVGFNATSFAMTYYGRQNGIQTQTIMGVVESVNPGKNVFVVHDRDEGKSTTVLTDAKTIASLSKGQTVRVTLNAGSPVAQSVAAGN